MGQACRGRTGSGACDDRMLATWKMRMVQHLIIAKCSTPHIRALCLPRVHSHIAAAGALCVRPVVMADEVCTSAVLCGRVLHVECPFSPVLTVLRLCLLRCPLLLQPAASSPVPTAAPQGNCHRVTLQHACTILQAVPQGSTCRAHLASHVFAALFARALCRLAAS